MDTMMGVDTFLSVTHELSSVVLREEDDVENDVQNDILSYYNLPGRDNTSSENKLGPHVESIPVRLQTDYSENGSDSRLVEGSRGICEDQTETANRKRLR